MENMYLLQHLYEYGQNSEHESTKILGVYSTKELAEEAINRYKILEGFYSYDAECFHICEMPLDSDSAWTEGFIGTDKLAQDFEYLTKHFNEWLGIEKTVEESWEDDNYYNALCEVNHELYHSKDINEFAESIQSIWLNRLHNNNKTSENYLEIALTLWNHIHPQ